MWLAFGLFYVDIAAMILLLVNRASLPAIIATVLAAPALIVGAHFAREVWLDSRLPNLDEWKRAPRFVRPND